MHDRPAVTPSRPSASPNPNLRPGGATQDGAEMTRAAGSPPWPSAARMRTRSDPPRAYGSGGAMPEAARSETVLEGSLPLSAHIVERSMNRA